MFLIHETFLVYKLEIFTNCKEVQYIVIMITAIIYIFCRMGYLMNSRKLLPENPQPPLKPLLPFTHSPLLKIQKVQAPLFCQH